MATIFFTGFPGFLGSELVPRVLRRSLESRAVCLVQGKFADLARRRVEEIAAAEPLATDRIQIVEGDITKSDLGLADLTRIQREVREVYHLAAVYDLGVSREPALRVNVEGTRHVLEFAAAAPRLERVHYVSTCYVSGRHAGTFTEEDLDVGQSFNNYYEETKFLAEVEVQAEMKRGLPATIYRPAVVTGDSRTGATQKYDGPYYIIRWLLKQPPLALMPVIGDARQTHFNVVPRDFVVNAIAHLSALPHSKSKVYQLADPDSPTVDQVLDEMARATQRQVIRVPIPLTLAKFGIENVPGVYQILEMPAEALNYFVHPTHYTTHNATTDLANSGIAVPPFASYVDQLVDFVRQHPEINAKAMI